MLSLAASTIGAVPTVERIDAVAGSSHAAAPFQAGRTAPSASAHVELGGMPEFPASATADLAPSANSEGSARRSTPSPANDDGMFLDMLGVDVPGPLSLALLGIGLLGLGLTRMNGFD